MIVKIHIDKMVLNNPNGENLIMETSGKNIGECLDCLVSQKPFIKNVLFDEKGELFFDKLYILNGKYELSDITNKAVNDGDEIKILKFPEG
jgi:molybdopterin converting factor small subunit